MVDIPVGVYTCYGIANGVAFVGKGVQTIATKKYAPQVDCPPSFKDREPT